MNTRTLIALLASLAVLVALAVAVSQSQRKTTGSGDLLLPDLHSQLNTIGTIIVRTGGDKTIATIAKQDDRWGVAERSGYPADIGRIRRNLIGLAEARILEEKTSNPELYDRLGVADIEKEAATGVRLDLGSASGTTSVILGNTGVGGGERAYARRAGETTSWLVSGSFDVPRETAQWLDQGILDIVAKRVHSVVISPPRGKTLRVEKASPETQDFTVTGVPGDRELSFPSAGNSIGAALTDLTLEDVEPAAGFSPGEVQPVVARYETFDGLVVEARTWQLPAGPRVRFSVSVDDALAARFAPAPAGAAPAGANDGTPQAAEPAAAPRKSPDAVKAEAAELQARLAAWVYTLPAHKGEQLTRTLDDLLAPRPPTK